MMDTLVLMIGFHLLSIILCPVGAVHSENRREDLIQDSVRKLLGVQSNPPEGRKTPLPPSYVMDLYEKYRSGRTPMQGNTVRSILPMRDTIGNADVLIFNLTGINPSEQILQSKLYLLKRRRPKPGKKRESNSHFRVKIGSLPHMTSHRYVEVSLTRHRSEWHSYDITESVVHCRQNTNNDQLLGVTLEVRRARGNYRLSPFRRLLKQDSQPFVLIFSEDSGNLTKGTSLRGSETQGEIQGLLRAKTGGASVLQGGSSERGLLLDRRKRSFNGQNRVQNGFARGPSADYRMFSVYEHFKNNAKLFGVGTLNSRLEKLKLLNELISSFSNDPDAVGEGFDRSKLLSRARGLKISSSRDNPEKVLDYYKLSRWRNNSSESDLEVVRHKRSVSSSTSATSKELTANASETFQNSLGDHKPTNSSVRDWSGLKKRKKNQNRGDGSRRRKKKKNKPGRKNNPKLPFWWTRHDSRLHTQDYGRLCQRKSLVVDFVQLGWGDWVISPKTFNAHYCSGGCSFPMIKNANPSNHAAIQSLMHAIGMAPEVPTPSCVPSVSSPLTLLFFDEHGNLVLKNYPNMIVEKCACR